MFHFLADQQFQLADMDVAIDMLLSDESLSRNNSLNQLSSSGLTPFEMAILSDNKQFLDIITAKSKDLAAANPVMIIPSQNMIHMLCNVATKSAQSLVEFFVKYFIPIIE